MNHNRDQSQKRKLTLPSLHNLIILDDAPLSPKAPKSPKIISSKGSPTRGRLPTCIICTDDLIIFDEEPAGESSPDSSSEKSGGTCSENTASKHVSSGCQRPIVVLKCGHVLHTACNNKWFLTNKNNEFKTCPICRKEMRSNDTRRVFLVFGEE